MPVKQIHAVEAFRNYLRFGKVRYYLDILFYLQKRQTHDIKRSIGLSLRECKFLLQAKVSPSCSLVSIQRQLYIPSSTAAWLAERLVKKGYLTRKQNPRNRREVILDLSRRGDQILLRVEKHFFTPEVSEKLMATSDALVAQIEDSIKTLCQLYGSEIRD